MKFCYEPRKNKRNDDVSTQKFRSRTLCRSEILTSLLNILPSFQITNPKFPWPNVKSANFPLARGNPDRRWHGRLC